MLDASIVVALIGAAVSVFGAIVGWWKATGVERLKGEIAVNVGKQLEASKAELAKDLAATESVLRVTAERQLGVFRLSAESAEAAMRCLRDWDRAIGEAIQSALIADGAEAQAAEAPARATGDERSCGTRGIGARGPPALGAACRALPAPNTG